MKETELYRPIADYLAANGYTVRAEVKGCDITAVKGDDLIIVEMKTKFSLELMLQAVDRQRISSSVYVAIPLSAVSQRGKKWRTIVRLLKRLEVGLIFVSIETGMVQTAIHPVPFKRMKDHRRTRAILTEMSGRSADMNVGGSTRVKLVTAYREQAIHVAWLLSQADAAAPAELCVKGAVKKCGSILYMNYYGWFDRVGVGKYRLSTKGKKALKEYPALIKRLQKKR
ncbi:MAG: hypothetical protein HZC28_12065 [Spirochaetes bacterium]|nr:hypothetical protein [Spirochaetota bacterium]